MPLKPKRKTKRTTAEALFDEATAAPLPSAEANPVEELLLIMRRNGCLELAIPGTLILKVDPAAFIDIVQPLQTMTIPPPPMPPGAEALFREMTDAELLTAHLPPEPIED